MKLTFTLKSFFTDKKEVKHQIKHFLLEPARLSIRLTFSDSSELYLPFPKRDDDGQFDDKGRFQVEIKDADLPDVAGENRKKIITRLLIDYFVDFDFDMNVFRLLRIVQEFIVSPGNSSDPDLGASLMPFGWAHAKHPSRKMANQGVHPLLDVSKLKNNEIGINALVVDITTLWNHLNRKNRFARYYRELTDAKRVTLKVFAHLGGNAFIWYAVVPAYLTSSKKVSPHVFYAPSDWGPLQNEPDEESYLFDNEEVFEARPGSPSESNGKLLLLDYLLPPIDDVQIPRLDPKEVENKSWFIKFVTATRRNVVTFKYADDKKKDILLNHWDIPAGFERAFYGLGKVQPQQILLVPQLLSTPKGNKKGLERERHLTNITDAILDVLQTNTDHLVTAAKDQLIEKDKMILSCYSESGPSLWRASTIHADRIKAIIGIEPNNVNPDSQGIVSTLLRKKVKVFFIGQHEGFKDHYRPTIAPDLQKQIRFLPDEPRKILKYPPDPDSNMFVRYRTLRATKKTLDPFMSDDEKQLLEDLEDRKPPAKGKAAIAVIFTEKSNSYDLKDQSDLVNIFYTHNFALTGGQDMEFKDPDDPYKKPVSYRTFFQQAVEEIG